jgi:hypothetical protein
MVYQFKIYSQESKSFQLEMSLDGNHSFFDFHTQIQKSLDFESHQLASFFVSDKKWKKEKEISLLDIGADGSAYYMMYKTKIADVIQNKEQKLLYTYDFFNDRSFYIELTGIIMERSLVEPLITFKSGDAPLQVLGEEAIEVDTVTLVEEEVFMDFGELEDYAEIYGDMNDF